MDWTYTEERFFHQRGMVAARQARSPSQARQLRRTARERGWERPFRGVCGPRMPFDLRRHQQAGLLWVGGPVAVTGWAALWLLGATDRVPPRTHLLVAHGRRNRYVRRFHVIRTRHLELAGISTVDRLQVVHAAWAVTDLAATATTSLLRSVLIDGRQRRCLRLEDVLDMLDLRGPIRGRRRLRLLIHQLNAVDSDSQFEHVVRRRIAHEPRLPPPDPRKVVVEASDGVRNEIDIGWTPARVGLECVGYGAHSSRRQLHVDAIRSNALAPSGWLIFHVTWTHLEDDRAWRVLVDQVCAQVHARANDSPR